MILTKPSATIESCINPQEVLQHIEKAGRVCYKSEEKITEESAIKLDPYSGAFYYDLGNVFLIRGLGNAALNNLREAEKYIDIPGLPQNLAVIYLAKGDTDRAIDLLKKAIS